jgi:hypothetical protein
MPNSSARISICWAAGSVEKSLISRFFAMSTSILLSF